MKITFVDNMEGTPARVRRDTGEIFLNREIWFSLPEPYRRFILEHEKGHYYLQTTNELLADQYAFEQVAGTFKGSLLQMVKTLADVLPFHSETHQVRLLNLYRLALEWDQNHTPQENTKRELETVISQLSNFSDNLEYMEYTNLAFSQQRKGSVSDYENTFGAQASLYRPSVGRYFHDVQKSEFEQKYGSQTQPVITTLIDTPVPENSGELVSLDLIPDLSKGVRLDIQTIFIVALIVLITLGISKL
ncbi:hypothetical protein ACRTDU_03910 [Sunxiuqinia elliptica]